MLLDCNYLQHLCLWAYDFSHSGTHLTLRRGMSESVSEQSSMVHRFIGRLAYWDKASLALLRQSSKFAELLRQAQVPPFSVDGNSDEPRPILDRNLEDLALMVFPNFRDTPIFSALAHFMWKPQDVLR